VILANQAYSQATWLGPLALLDVGFVVQVPFFATPTEIEGSVCLEI
jgi:hypothetical protein